MNAKIKQLALGCLAALPLVLSGAQAAGHADGVAPGAVWLDDRGQQIQAHGGDVVRFGDTWYWYGEDYSKDPPAGTRGVACYSSQDLMHWRYRNRVLSLTDAQAGYENFILERPKVFHNARTGKFVMYMHLDSAKYKAARVGVAVCDTCDGQFTYLRSFRPLDKESRDIGQFIDDDGSAYLIFESRPEMGFFIARLSDDYLDVEKETCFIKSPIEGGCVVHYKGLYYVVGSNLTGWQPNPNKYATAKKLEGPWSEFKDIAPPAKKTYGAQSTYLIKVVGSRETRVIFMGDKWNPKALWDSRYVWMPLKIGDGKLRLPEPVPWSIDVQTGGVSFPAKN